MGRVRHLPPLSFLCSRMVPFVNSIFLQSILATLPLLSQTLSVRKGLVCGGIGACLFLAATMIFALFRPLLPKGTHSLSLLFSLITFGIVGGEVFHGGTAWVVPLLILAPTEFFRRRENPVGILESAFLSSLLFWGLLATHGITSEVLGLRAGIRFFQLPGGSYLFLGLATLAFSLVPSLRRKV